MKKWWYVSMLVVLICLPVTAATAEAPEAEVPEAVAPEAEAPEAVAPEAISVPAIAGTEAPGSGLAGTAEVELMSATDEVFCQFLCNDGIGLGYLCPDPGLGTCCLQAQPACASHGGLDDSRRP